MLWIWRSVVSHYYVCPKFTFVFLWTVGIDMLIFSGKDVSLRESWAGTSGSDLSLWQWFIILSLIVRPTVSVGPVQVHKRVCVYLNLSREGWVPWMAVESDLVCPFTHSEFFFFFLIFCGLPTIGWAGPAQGYGRWATWPWLPLL